MFVACGGDVLLHNLLVGFDLLHAVWQFRGGKPVDRLHIAACGVDLHRLTLPDSPSCVVSGLTG